MAGTNIYGELIRAQAETWSADPTAGVTGRFGRNSTEGRLKWDNGTNYRAILTNDDKLVVGNNGTANNNIRLYRSAASTLTFALGGDATAEGSSTANLANITAKFTGCYLVDAFECTGIATPSNPAAGNFKLYFKSDGLLYALTSAGSESTVATTASVQDQSFEVNNLGLATSIAGNAITIALKQKSGSDPAAGSSAVNIGFRNSTLTTGTYNIRSVTGALSVTVSSGSTLGLASATDEYIYIYAIDNAGTVELAVMGGENTVDEGTVATTTAEGGAGAADSRNTLYSATARANVPIRLIGRIKVNEATSGTYASNASEISVLPIDDFKGHIASQADMETGTATARYVSPARAQFHPSAWKFWLKADLAGGIGQSYNVTSITDTGTGVIDVTIATDFSTTTWAGFVTQFGNAGGTAATTRIVDIESTNYAAGTCRCVSVRASDGAVLDPATGWFIGGVGDQ